jgi:Heparinase II/III-like protein
VFEYVDGPKRSMSRSTHSHNTLAIAGMEQADFFGSFRCGRRPRVSIHDWKCGPDGFILEGSHNGFAPVTATRRVEASTNSVKITDRLDQEVGGRAHISLLLHPDCTLVLEGLVATITNKDAVLVIEAQHPWAIEPAVYWPDMGTELPSERLRLTLPVECRTNQITLKMVTGKRAGDKRD